MHRGDVGSRPLRFFWFLLAVLAMTQASCGNPKLVMEDNELGSWIAMNNTFAMPPPADREVDKIYFWTGILIQIGNLHAENEFDEVNFSKNGSLVGTALKWSDYPSGEAFWVNIVSRSSENHVDPLKPEKVLELCPGPYLSPHPCSVATGDPICLRTAQLHPGMDRVIGVITYWQGPNGFDLEAKQEEEFLDNRFDFKLKDDFKVEVYEISTGTNPRTVTPIITHDFGAIDLITVKKKPTGPQDGDKQDPPWPPPPP